MEIKNMTVEQIEARRAEIVTELDKPEADLDALQEEMRNLNAELEARKAAEAKKAEIRKARAKLLLRPRSRRSRPATPRSTSTLSPSTSRPATTRNAGLC